MDESAEMGYMYVTGGCRSYHAGTYALPAFFGIIDLLSVAPYYIELMLHQDTVRLIFPM